MIGDRSLILFSKKFPNCFHAPFRREEVNPVVKAFEAHQPAPRQDAPGVRAEKVANRALEIDAARPLS